MNIGKTHVLSGAVPIPTGKHLKEMVESIRDHGLLEPIVLYQGLILDGRRRVQAVNKLAISRFELSDEHFTTFTGTWNEAAVFVRNKFLATIDDRFRECGPAKFEENKRKVLDELAALAAEPQPDPPASELPVIPPSFASLMAAIDTLDRRARAFVAADIAAHRRGRRTKAHERVMDVVTRLHDLGAAVTDAQVRAFLETKAED